MLAPGLADNRAGGTPDNGVLDMGWEFFGELCRGLALKVARSGWQPEIIVGIAKAGVIPGAVVASILRKDFFSLKISRDVEGMTPAARPRILSAAPKEARGRRVLIVDEVCTSGETLRMATNALRQVGPEEIRTATSLVKVGGHRPDFYALETDATAIFPWDRVVVNEDGDIVTNPMYEGLVEIG
ncbi:MAG: phosphoribosyltransferase family protein [Gemmatimonadota bacterium]